MGEKIKLQVIIQNTLLIGGITEVRYEYEADNRLRYVEYRLVNFEWPVHIHIRTWVLTGFSIRLLALHSLHWLREF